MPRKQKYPLNRIRRNYTYTAQQVADLYGIEIVTVYRWVKNEGLLRLKAKSKKIFIHGNQLYRFLRKRNEKGKKPCSEHEIYCFKCKTQRFPEPQSIKIEPMANKCVRVIALCLVCDNAMNKPVSLKKWSEKHPLHPNNHTPKTTHDGAQQSQYECLYNKGEQTCLNLTPTTK